MGFIPSLYVKMKLTNVQLKLVNEALFVIRETMATFKNPCILWAGGKDSTTMLYLMKKAFDDKIPFPTYLLDTTYQFRETYDFMDSLARDWKIDFIRIKNMDALNKGISPETTSKFDCCNQLKTINLKKMLIEKGHDAVFVGIRWDECGVRGKEQHFSKRGDPEHIRIHPMLNWSEKDIWSYIRSENIPYNPLYDRVEHENLVFRSIGCYPCTKPTEKTALSERSGRALDKEEIMESLRALGYM